MPDSTHVLSLDDSHLGYYKTDNIKETDLEGGPMGMYKSIHLGDIIDVKQLKEKTIQINYHQ